MKTILQIIEEVGGLPKAECISIDNEPWMRLVIEVPPERGPDGHVVVSVAHYGDRIRTRCATPKCCSKW